MATVWVTLASEAVVLLTAAGAAVAWVRRSPAGTHEHDLGQPAAPLVEQAA